jgi:hypothetical protein
LPSFKDFAKRLEDLQQDVPKIFEKVAKKGAIKFVNEAKARTDKEGLVDTGAYKRSWQAQTIEPMPEIYGVECKNNMEYASHLEYGHKLRNGKRWKGRFVGDLSMNEARYYCMQQLQKAIDKAMKKN